MKFPPWKMFAEATAYAVILALFVQLIQDLRASNDQSTRTHSMLREIRDELRDIRQELRTGPTPPP